MVDYDKLAKSLNHLEMQFANHQRARSRTPAQRQLVAELKKALEESDLPYLVDLLVWDDLPNNFHRNITEKHVVLLDGEHDCSETDQKMFTMSPQQG